MDTSFKKAFTVLLNFSRSLVSLNTGPCMIRPTLTDLNQIKFIHYPFISLDKCKGSYIAVDDLSTKICLLSETKVVNAIKYLTPQKNKWSKNISKRYFM